MIAPENAEHSECMGILRPVRDALDILNGKWKLPIIVALTFGEKRFTEIAREVQGITDRMLSKELRDLVKLSTPCVNGEFFTAKPCVLTSVAKRMPVNRRAKFLKFLF
jgi:hypothetical protein